MTVFGLVPVTNGPYILTRVFADTVFVGELTLRRGDYGDLALRLGATAAFDRSGRPVPVSSSVERPSSWPAVVATFEAAAGDLHDGLHPQPGEAPAAPVPDDVEGWAPGRAARSADYRYLAGGRAEAAGSFPDPSYVERGGVS